MASITLGILATVYAGPDASKRMARDAGTSHRTAEKWWAAITTPRADVLMRMAQRNEALRAEMLRALAGASYAGLVDQMAGDAGQASSGAGASLGGAAGIQMAGAAACGGHRCRRGGHDVPGLVAAGEGEAPAVAQPVWNGKERRGAEGLISR